MRRAANDGRRQDRARNSRRHDLGKRWCREDLGTSSENNGACFDELREFIAAASQRDELPQYREALATDSRRAAEKLIALQGNARGG